MRELDGFVAGPGHIVHRVHVADGPGVVPLSVIVIDADLRHRDHELETLRMQYEQDAEEIRRALTRSLPRATMDRLLALLLLHRASDAVVAEKADGIVEVIARGLARHVGIDGKVTTSQPREHEAAEGRTPPPSQAAGEA